MEKEHILVCLSSAPSNAKIVRAAAKMAKSHQAYFTALYVETPDFNAMSKENKQRLQENIRNAQELGAKVEIVYGDDIPYLIAEFARLAGVSTVVIGRSSVKRRRLPGEVVLTEQLIEQAPELDIHIIPDSITEKNYYKSKKAVVWSGKDLYLCSGILVLATLIGGWFSKLGFTEANIILVYILAVLMISVVTKYRIFSLVSSLVSVLVFNFFFTEPKYTLLAYHQGYPVTFLVMFLVAFMTSTLAVRLKNNAKQSARAAYRTKILFDTNQLLQQAQERNEIFVFTVQQIIQLLKKDVILYVAEKNELGDPQGFSASDQIVDKVYYSEDEKKIARWVLKNNKRAGAATDYFSDANCIYYGIWGKQTVYGVIGIVTDGEQVDAFENSVLISILGECALALENEKNAREKEEVKLIAQNEKLRANLLRAISHDLRTPLTSISGNASNLITNGEEFDFVTKRQIYEDIYDDSMWLINLVENLLAITKIEDGQVQLRMEPELIDEVIEEALLHVHRKGMEHRIVVKNSDEFVLARMDARLIVQVIINLVDNAIKYSPRGSLICIESQKKEKEVILKISDNGSGIPDELKEKVFEMFFSGANKVADSRRSLGLGLYLCRAIVQAHGGKITVSDNIPCGAVFTITLTAEEIDLHE